MSRLKAWIGTFGTNVVIVLAGVLTGVLSARFLLPGGRGELAAVLLWPQLIAGLGLFSLREAITHRASDSAIDHAALTSNGLVAAGLLAVISCVSGLGAMPHLLGAERAYLVPLAQAYLLLFVPSNFLAMTLLAVDHGKQRFSVYNLQRLLPPIIYLIGLVVLWRLNRINVTNVVYANLIGTVCVAGLRLWTLRGFLSLGVRFSEAKLLLKTGLRFHGITILLVLAAQADQVLAVANLSNKEIGLYMVALTMAASGFGLVVNSTYDVLFPALSALKGTEDQAHLIGRGLRVTTLLLLTVSISLCILTPWLIPLLFGHAFQGAVVPAQFLLLAYIPVSLRQMTVRAIRGLGETLPATMAEALALLVFISIGWSFARKFGLVGLISAVMLAGTLAYSFLVNYLHRRLGLSYRQMVGLNMATIREVIAYGRAAFQRRGHAS
jgi:O-antigen/teichoic acid export membrane protein